MAAGPAPPTPLAHFLELFAAGRYWDSHEALEDAWRRLDSDFYQGLILYASAFVHARRGNRHGILAQLEKTRRALEPYRPAYLGIDVDGLLEHADRCRRRVEAREAPPEGEDWTGLLPEPRLAWSAGRVRGDEPEVRPPRPGPGSSSSGPGPDP